MLPSHCRANFKTSKEFRAGPEPQEAACAEPRLCSACQQRLGWRQTSPGTLRTKTTTLGKTLRVKNPRRPALNSWQRPEAHNNGGQATQQAFTGAGTHWRWRQEASSPCHNADRLKQKPSGNHSQQHGGDTKNNSGSRTTGYQSPVAEISRCDSWVAAISNPSVTCIPHDQRHLACNAALYNEMLACRQQQGYA